MRQRWYFVGECGLIFCALVIIFYLSPVRTPYDSRWSIHVALSFLRGDWGDLSYFRPIIDSDNGAIYEIYSRFTPGVSNFLSYFPIGNSILSLPFVAFALLYDPSLVERARHAIPSNLEAAVAAFYCSAAGVLLYHAARRKAGVWIALTVVVIFALASPIWSTATRALWMHGPQVFLFTLAFVILLRGDEKPDWVPYAGFPLAMAFIVRPTAVIEIALFSLYVLVRHRDKFRSFVVNGMLVGAIWAIYNASMYRLVPHYYFPERVAASNTLMEALAGNLFSPARGLFVFSPIFVLSIAGTVLAMCDRLENRFLLGLTAAACVLHWILISRFPHWWGGFSYGPRLMTDVVPFLAWLTIPALQALSRLRWRGAAVTCVAVLLAVSVTIHMAGAVSYRGYAWNTSPTNLDVDPGRLWNWSDTQFVRAVKGLAAPNLRASPGAIVDFRAAGNSDDVVDGAGWAGAERDGRWAMGEQVELVFRKRRPGSLIVGVDAVPFVVPSLHPALRVTILADGVQVGHLTLSDPAPHRFEVALPEGRTDGLRLTFRFDSPVSPQLLGIGADPRPLAMLFRRLEIRDVE